MRNSTLPLACLLLSIPMTLTACGGGDDDGTGDDDTAAPDANTGGPDGTPSPDSAPTAYDCVGDPYPTEVKLPPT